MKRKLSHAVTVLGHDACIFSVRDGVCACAALASAAHRTAANRRFIFLLRGNEAVAIVCLFGARSYTGGPLNLHGGETDGESKACRRSACKRMRVHCTCRARAKRRS